jgi:hypothetical protein
VEVVPQLGEGRGRGDEPLLLNAMVGSPERWLDHQEYEGLVRQLVGGSGTDSQQHGPDPLSQPARRLRGPCGEIDLGSTVQINGFPGSASGLVTSGEREGQPAEHARAGVSRPDLAYRDLTRPVRCNWQAEGSIIVPDWPLRS